MAALQGARRAGSSTRQPRPGAHGSRIAFIHPASAGGLLIELKQPAVRAERSRDVRRLRADLAAPTASSASTAARCSASCRSRSGSGARRRRAQPHPARPAAAARAHRPAHNVLIDAGIGDKMSAEGARDLRASIARRDLEQSLAAAGLTRRATSTSCIATHLHFDHAGGFTTRVDGDASCPRFPRATLLHPPRRVGGRDASARAQPRQLSAGELRAARATPASSTSSTTTARCCRASACGAPAATRCTTSWSGSSPAAGRRSSPPI